MGIESQKRKITALMEHMAEAQSEGEIRVIYGDILHEVAKFKEFHKDRIRNIPEEEDAPDL